MPPRKAPPKQSELLEKEAKEMESIMAMLRSQIDEERAKVQPKGTRWAAAAEGPTGKFDPYGPLARKILAKKKPQPAQSAPESPPQASPERSPKPQKTVEHTKSDSSTEPIDTSSPKTRKIEVVVEPQGGKLWGNYCDSSCQPEDAPKGGSLWGPPPDEAAESAKFREEVAKLRGQKTTVSSGSGPSTTVSSGSGPATSTTETQDDLPPIGAGGALWGPPPNEVEEQMKFQRIVAKMRGEDLPPAPADQVASETSAKLVECKKTEPTAFTYFDMLMNKDVLDGSRVVDKK